MKQAEKTLLLNCFHNPENRAGYLQAFKQEVASAGATTVFELEKLGAFTEAFSSIIEELSKAHASEARAELIEIAEAFRKHEESVSIDSKRAATLAQELAGVVIEDAFTQALPPGKRGTLILVCVNCVFDDPDLIITRARDMVITRYMQKLGYDKYGMSVHPVTHELEYVFAGPRCANPDAKAADVENDLTPRVKGLRYVSARSLLSSTSRANRAAKAVSLATHPPRFDAVKH